MAIAADALSNPAFFGTDREENEWKGGGDEIHRRREDSDLWTAWSWAVCSSESFLPRARSPLLFLVYLPCTLKIVLMVTPPRLKSRSGSDSQSSTPAYSSSATSSASTVETSITPPSSLTLSFLFHLTFFSALFYFHFSFTPTLYHPLLTSFQIRCAATSHDFSLLCAFTQKMFSLSPALCVCVCSFCLSLCHPLLHCYELCLCFALSPPLHLALSHSVGRWDSVKQCHLPARPSPEMLHCCFLYFVLLLAYTVKCMIVCMRTGVYLESNNSGCVMCRLSIWGRGSALRVLNCEGPWRWQWQPSG